MKLYTTQLFSEEEGDLAEEAKTVYIHASKEKLIALSEFFSKVATELESSDDCHMHFRDFLPGWNKTEDIDIAIEKTSFA